MRLIDADAFLASQIKSCHCVPLLYDGNENHSWEDLKQALNNAPTIDAEPVRHGHWVMKKTATGAPYTVCSHCNASVKYNDEYGTVVMNLKGANYCPNCGAKMDEN